jgi:hypothetical protein
MSDGEKGGGDVRVVTMVFGEDGEEGAVVVVARAGGGGRA